ncbi:MAG TPA: ABC transporter substrate-binding protein [Geobacterales bacterium]|nr:ABC transporter substrate-binding protein [Geobacterales bacterium]
MTGKNKLRIAISRVLALIIIIIVVFGVIIGIYFYYSMTSSKQVPQINLFPASFGVLQNDKLTFSLSNLVVGSKVIVYFGDGHKMELNVTSSSESLDYQYSNVGNFLVYADEVLNGKVISSTENSLIEIRVSPKVEKSIADYISIPTISFDVTKNSEIPIVNVNESLYLFGGYLQPPTNPNVTLKQYIWNFGNGKTLALDINSTNNLPIQNPVSISYTSEGIYALNLTLITEDESTGKKYSYTVFQTIAVKGTNHKFALFKFAGTIPNPDIINVAENLPGGPFSLDPNVDYELVGFEVISNIFSTLLIYNGSSTTSFIPYVAEQLPTVENGGISNNYTKYTFKIRSNLRFSNGDPLTAYDVWYSIIRALLFEGGNPGTGDWVVAQYLVEGASIGVPLVTNENKQEAFSKIMNAVSYDNNTNTVTFNLIKPTPPQLFFTALAFPLATAILDSKWLKNIGAGITFTPDGFLAYEEQANIGNYNTEIQYNPVGSGPYMIQSYVPGQTIVLAPNPYFPGLPGIPKVNNKVVISWVKDAQTAYNLFVSGQADIVTGLPSQYFPSLRAYVQQGQVAIYKFSTLTQYFMTFNLQINTTLLKNINPQYDIPSDYFANPKVREAFAYAFDYQTYIDNIVGNKKYGYDFGNLYAGAIISTLPFYVPPEQLQHIPTFNKTRAEQLLREAGVYDLHVRFPIMVPQGDSVNYAAAQMLADTIHSIDPNIEIEPLYVQLPIMASYLVPGSNPMPIAVLFWIADYPHPRDVVDAMYLENGTFPGPDGWYPSYLRSLGYNDEAVMYEQLTQLILKADSEIDPIKAQGYYKQVEQLAIDLYMYIYLYQTNGFWVVKSYMHGYNNDITYQENPITAGAGASLYFWWVKG